MASCINMMMFLINFKTFFSSDFRQTMSKKFPFILEGMFFLK